MAFATCSPPATISDSNRFLFQGKKKPFLLLEILIAIFLVTICLIPLIQSPIQSYRAEMRLLEEMEGERLAEWTFSEVKEKFLHCAIPWDSLPAYQETSSPIPMASAQIEIPGALPKNIERSFHLFCKGEKEGPQGEIYKILYVNIHFSPSLSQKKEKKLYPYRLVVCQD